jgi:hypothetical protein
MLRHEAWHEKLYCWCSDENESASSKARLDPDALVKYERNGNERDHKRTYDDPYARTIVHGSRVLSPERKGTRYDEPYDRPSNRRPTYDDRNEREGAPPTSRRRFDEPSSSMVRSC